MRTRSSIDVAQRQLRVCRGCASRLLGVCGVVAASIASQLWTAWVRCRHDGHDTLTDVRWSSAWLWTAIVLTAWTAYGLGLAWLERDRAMRPESRLRSTVRPNARHMHCLVTRHNRGFAMGRLVLLLIGVLGWAVLTRKPRPRRLFGTAADAFAFPTAAAHGGIDLSDAGVVREWCERFDCTEEQLRAAIKVAGTSAEDVRWHLIRPR